MFSAPQLLTVALPGRGQLGLTRYGNPSHPALLFHHGYASSGLAVPECAALLAELGLQVLAFDRPGVGASDVDEELSMESFAEDVQLAAHILRIPTPFALAGWSGGGPYALAQAARLGPQVASVQLLSTVLPFGDQAAYEEVTLPWKAVRFLNDYLPLLGKAALAELSEQWQTRPDALIDQFFALQGPAEEAIGAQPYFHALLRDAAVHGFAHEGLGVYYDGRSLCKPTQFQLSAIQAPTTLWHGTADGIWEPGSLSYLTHHIPNARLRLLDGAGHMLYLEHWEAILRQVRAELPQ